MTEIALRCAREVFGRGCAGRWARRGVVGERALTSAGAWRCGLGRSMSCASLEGADMSVAASIRLRLSLAGHGRVRARGLAAAGCDLVVAAGGGSALDGQAIAALAPLTEPVISLRAPRRGPAVVHALPTTAGTGAEVTPNSVLTDTASGLSASIRGHALLPEIALSGPELTVTCPPDQTALPA